MSKKLDSANDGSAEDFGLLTQTAEGTRPSKAVGSKEKSLKEKKTKRPRKIIEPPPKKIEAFLSQIESEKDTLTLEDVERYKPPKIPHTRSQEYEKEYNDVFGTLTRSFSMPKLREIFNLYNMPQLPTSHQKKIPYAEQILEKWGWTPLAVVQRNILDQTKVSECQFPLGPGEAFLLMGKDGAELLNLAKRYDVHLSFTGYPISLRVKGLQGSVKRLEGYLKSFKKDIEVETISLPLQQSIPSETFKSISRLSGAYLAPEDDKVFRSF
ncbi:hypothetical protein BDZ97DRAFT_1648269 [Flammula alnicola]|nr:hypothetical protein BDZ97DRAFT_1648269 [Flammula alnicola]